MKRTYIPFKRNDGVPRCCSRSSLAYQLLATDVTGKKGEPNLITETNKTTD